MILNAFSLEGKVAVVTGCDTGLGQGMALGPLKRVAISSVSTLLNRQKPSNV